MKIQIGALACLLGVLNLGGDPRRKYDEQRAPDFLFEVRPWESHCSERAGAYRIVGQEPPVRKTRLDHLTFSRNDVPALTVAPGLYSSVRIEGSTRRDWSAQLCAEGNGQDDAEAQSFLAQASMSRSGGLLTTANPPFDHKWNGQGSLYIQAPGDAPIIVSAPFSYIELRDLSGPVRAAASHARASIFNTRGRVEVSAAVIDFMAASGQVLLSAEAEINIKITAQRFAGSLVASGPRPVRLLIPAGFQSSIEAIVNREKDFICRADICSEVKKEKRDGLYVFSFVGEGGLGKPVMQLRSEQSTVVIDNSTGN